jgi:ABC-type polysaccharide/polyol phosphate export permease
MNQTSRLAALSAPLARTFPELWEMASEQVQYREVLRQMVRRDLMLRYKQTLMGMGWAAFMPIVNTIVFSVIFTRVAPIDVGTPYPLYAFCGLLAWNFFASALRFSVASLTSNQILVSKVFFPREIFPLSAVIVSLVDFAVAGLVLAALMAYYGWPVTLAVLALPLVIAVHVIWTTAIALLLAMGNLFYRDVKYLFEILITIWMFATSVLYPIQLVGGRTGAFLEMNPITHIIDAYRAVLLYGALPSTAFGVVALVGVVVLVAAWSAFHRAEFAFAESL